MLNKKLTPIIKGRTIKEAMTAEDALHIEFEDGSKMKVKLQNVPNSITGKEVKAVRQKGTAFNLDFTDGTSAQFALAEETSSVMLRNAAGEMEYAD